MKKLVLMALFAISLFGCASEQYFVGHGSEALVYKEHHSFKFEIKSRAETTKQLDVLIHKIESMDKEATYLVDYKSAVNKKMLQDLCTVPIAHHRPTESGLSTCPVITNRSKYPSDVNGIEEPRMYTSTDSCSCKAVRLFC